MKLLPGQVVIWNGKPARVLWADAGRVRLEIAWGPVVTVSPAECRPTEQHLAAPQADDYWPKKQRGGQQVPSAPSGVSDARQGDREPGEAGPALPMVGL